MNESLVLTFHSSDVGIVPERLRLPQVEMCSGLVEADILLPRGLAWRDRDVRRGAA